MSRRTRQPGQIPGTFVYRTFEDALIRALRRAGITLDINATYTDAAIPIVDAVEKAWGLYPLGYDHAGAGLGGDNWYLPDAFAFINIYRHGRNRGRISVIADNEDDDTQAVYFRLATGKHVRNHYLTSDLPGIATWSIEYRNKAEFLAALREADIRVRDNEANEAMLALYRNNPDALDGESR